MYTAISRSISLRVGYFFAAFLPAVIVIVDRGSEDISVPYRSTLTHSFTASFFSTFLSSHENLPVAPLHFVFGARSEEEEVESATRRDRLASLNNSCAWVEVSDDPRAE